jgi:hypothetical protein
MNIRRNFFLGMIAAAIMAVCIPALASAQGYWGQYGGGYNRDYRYDRNALRDAVKRVKDRSKDFENGLDRSLDHSRYDGSRREDRLNQEARNFRSAAEDLKDRIGDAKNLDRSANQARRLIEIGSRIDRFVGNGNVDGRTMNYWYSVRRDLQYIADAYGFRMGDFGGSYRNDRNDPYRNDSYRSDRNRGNGWPD